MNQMSSCPHCLTMGAITVSGGCPWHIYCAECDPKGVVNETLDGAMQDWERYVANIKAKDAERRRKNREAAPQQSTESER